MHRASRLPLVGVGLTVALLLWLATIALSAGVGGAKERRQADRPRGEAAQATEVNLTPSRGSGVRGTATLEGVARGVKVTLQMRNLPEAGVKHINHIHGGGTCADDRAGRTAPVTIPLKAIVAQQNGRGSATTTIKDVSVAQLFSEDRESFILLHAKTEKGEGVPPGISCADLRPLVESGGVSPAAVLLAGALLAWGGAAAVAALALGRGRG
jgi:Cu/Zn superoxide dismutase